MSASVSGLTVAVNEAEDTSGNFSIADALDWQTTFSTPVDPGANFAPAGSVSLPVNFTSGELSLAGSLSSLNVFGVITGSAGFALSESTIDSAANATVPLAGATLITVALDNLSVSAGSDGFGISLSGGDLGIAVVKAPTPTQSGVTDNRYWIAVVGSNFTASLAIGSFASASLTGLSVSVNTAGGQEVNGTTTTAATAFDWSTEFSPEINPGQNLPSAPSLSITIPNQEFSLAGSLASLDIATVINQTWSGMTLPSFTLSESTVNVSFTGSAPASLTNASLFEIGFANLPTISAGTGNFGVSLSGQAIALALIEPPAPASGTDSRYWLAISASGLGGSLSLGGSSAVSASVSGLALAINTSGGTSSTAGAASPLNWAADVSLDDGSNFGGTSNEPVISGQTIDDATGQFSLSGSLSSLNIFNVLTGSADFALSSTTIGLTQGATVLSGATLITVALSSLSVSVGTSSLGLSITSGTAGYLGIAFVEPPAPSSGTDSRYWVAVDASGLAASLNLGGSITATVSNINIAINQAGGTGPDGTAAAPLNWLSSISGTTVPVNPGLNLTSAVQMPIQYTAGSLTFAGSLTKLNIFNLVTGSANFAFNVSTVDVNSPSLSDATLITLGLSNFQTAAGSGAFGLTVSGGTLGVALLEAPSPSTQYWVAVDGTGLAASVALGGLVTATVNNVAIQINEGEDSNSANSPPAALDWATAISTNGGTSYGATVDPGANLPTPVSMPITYNGAGSCSSSTAL